METKLSNKSITVCVNLAIVYCNALNVDILDPKSQKILSPINIMFVNTKISICLNGFVNLHMNSISVVKILSFLL